MQEEIKALIKRVSDLEKEVTLLKHQLAHHTRIDQTTIIKPKEAPRMKPETVKESVTPDKGKMEHTPQPSPDIITIKRQVEQTPTPAPTQKKEVNIEKLLGIWLPRVFMFVLILGVLWGLKLGIDQGWISLAARIVMGYAATAILYYLGMRYVKQSKKMLGLTLLGGLIALGILTTFAAHHLYGFFNFALAFLIGVAYIVLGLYLSKKTRSETLTIFSAIAGFLLPFLLEGGEASAIQFFAYITLLFVSLFYMSLNQKHKISFYITFLLFHLTLLFYSVIGMSFNDKHILVISVLVQHLCLLIFYLDRRVSKQVFTETLIYTNTVFTVFWIQLLDQPFDTMTYGMIAVLYTVLAANAFVKKQNNFQGVFSAVAIFVISVFILSFDLDNEQVKLILLLINGSVGLWVGLRYQTIRTIVMSSIIYGISGLVVLNGINIDYFVSLEHLVWIMFLLTLAFIYYSLYQFVPLFKKGNITLIDAGLIGGQIISLIYIAQLVHLFVLNQNWLSFTAFHFYALVFIIVLAFMYYLHKWRHGKYVTYASMIEYLILGLALIARPIYDWYDLKWFEFNLAVQIIYITLLTLAFIMLVRKKSTNAFQGLMDKIPTFAVVMQIVHFIFLNKWYFAITNAYQWDREYVFFVHTFIWFLFAFLSISIGRKMKWKPVTILGSVLIGLSLFKLFFIDLANISIFIRAILFIVVGVIGLLYSRTLIKEDEK